MSPVQVFPVEQEKLTIESFIEMQCENPHFAIRKIEEGKHESDYILSDSDGNTVIVTRAKYEKKRPLKPIKEKCYYIFIDKYDSKVWLTKEQWIDFNTKLRPKQKRKRSKTKKVRSLAPR